MKCPKCSNPTMGKPRYFDHYGHGGLRYTCPNCGYSKTTLAHDHESYGKDEFEIFKNAFNHAINKKTRGVM